MKIILARNPGPLLRQKDPGALLGHAPITRAEYLSTEMVAGVKSKNTESASKEVEIENEVVKISIYPRVVNAKWVLGIDLEVKRDMHLGIRKGATLAFDLENIGDRSVLSLSTEKGRVFMEFWEEIFKPLFRGSVLGIEAEGVWEEIIKAKMTKDLGL